MRYNEELHKTVHWRSFRKTAVLLSKLENISIVDYDLNHVTCYTIMGFELMGKNVTFKIKNAPGRACFVDSNEYDIFEIPKYSNVRQSSGNYLFLAHNKSFDYWIYGNLTVSSRVIIEPMGFYHVAVNGERVSLEKIVCSRETGYGVNNTDKVFDFLGVRQKAYGRKASDVYAEKRGFSNNIKTLKGGNKVKIYKKR